MKKIKQKIIFANYSLPIGIILILSFSRLIPHPPNVTPVIAVAIMSTYFFKDIYVSLAALLISMILADFFIGFHSNIIFVYASLAFITFIFTKVKKKIKFNNLIIYGLLGSILFFLISNFGVWLLSGLYTKNLSGLIECYIMAIPFFVNTLFSTIFFSYTALIAHKATFKKFAL